MVKTKQVEEEVEDEELEFDEEELVKAVEEKPKAKKAPKKPKAPEITVNDLKVGDVIPDHKGNDIEITEDIVEQMMEFETANPKSHAIWKGKITGTFLYFKYYEDNPAPKKAPKAKKAPKKPKAKAVEIEEELTKEEIDAGIEADELEEVEELDEELEEELSDEENELLDCMADYKAETGYKKVNTNTKKFKKFFDEWKKSE